MKHHRFFAAFLAVITAASMITTPALAVDQSAAEENATCVAAEMNNVDAQTLWASRISHSGDSERYERMIALKSEYPEGMSWNNSNYYGWSAGVFSGGYGCAGFAMLLSDAAYGKEPPAEKLDSFAYEDLRVGDILRINNDTHSVAVLEIYDDHIVIAEGNYNESIHWGRTLTRSQVEEADYLLTRIVSTEDDEETPEEPNSFVGAFGDGGATALGNTVTLVKDFTITEENYQSVAIPSDITLVVPKDVTLTLSTEKYLGTCLGVLKIEAGGSVNLSGSEGTSEAWIGGENSCLNLTEGSITFAFQNRVFTLNGKGTVPAGKDLYLRLNGAGMNGIIGEGSTLTVADGGTFKVVADSSLQVLGTLEVQGLLTIAEDINDVTVVGTLSLPKMTKAEMAGEDADTGLRGDIKIHSGATMEYNDFKLLSHEIGEGYLELSSNGYITLNLSKANGEDPSAALTLNLGTASVNGGSALSSEKDTLVAALDAEDGLVPFAVSVKAGTSVIIPKDKTLVLPDGSSVNGEGTLDVQGKLEVNSKASVSGSATVGSTGEVQIHGSETPEEQGTISATFTVTNGSQITVDANRANADKIEVSGGTLVQNSDGSWSLQDSDDDDSSSSAAFTDVQSTDWFYDAVKYVYENGLMTGTGKTTFEPAAKLNRAQAVQILYNLEGQPSVTGTTDFTDVNGHWALKAITWGSKNGVVVGVGNNQFDPNGNVTRQQFAQMMYNYAKFKGCDMGAAGDLNGFSDVSEVSSWAKVALAWANGESLINGNEDGTLNPGGTTIRGQAASILMKFDQNVVK